MRRAGLKAQRKHLSRPRFRPRISIRQRMLTATPIFPSMVGQALGVELKFYDQLLIGGALTASTDASGGEHDPSATVLLNTVTQGDGESQRDGRKLTMRSIYIDGQVNVGSQSSKNTADEGTQIFIALVLDTQTNGATIVSENVFKNVGGNAVTAALPMRNLKFTKRFKVLAVRHFKMQNTSMTNDSGSTGGIIIAGLTQRFKIYKKLNIEVNYSGTSESVVNIVDNSLHIIAWATSTTLTPLISYGSRLRFQG